MSDGDESPEEKPFAVERAKTGRAKCKKCKCPIEQGVVRVAKLMSNPFGDGKMKAWHHLTCIFEVFAKQRPSTKRIDDLDDDVAGWQELDDEGKELVQGKLEEFNDSAPVKNANKKISPGKKNTEKRDSSAKNDSRNDNSSNKGKTSVGGSKSSVEPIPATSKASPKKETPVGKCRDDAFREFRRLCASVANANAYTSKTAIVRQMLTKGCEGDGFKGDVTLWCKMLLPGVTKRVYNLQSKQLVKLFSRMFNKDEDEMLEHLEQGDVAETIHAAFENSSLLQPSAQSHLTIREVDQFLDKLSLLTKEDEQIQHFKSIVTRCTANDLKMIIRLVKHDLRITAGPKHILDAIHEDAYAAFQSSRDLETVVSRFVEDSPLFSSSKKSAGNRETDPKRTSTGSKVGLTLMTPVLPMLAEACKSVEMAMRKCPDGMLSEIKYDGERVQVHKQGNQFRYFSRSLKPVMPHKVNHFHDFISKAFPGGDDLILDTEVLMIDTNTGKPLPFGSLGVHKKAQFKDANVCLFVFDCLYYNGETLMDKSMQKRRSILKEKMVVIPNRIMLSEVEEVQDPKDLAHMIAKVIKMGLEGLVLKDVTGKYEPGKRHWLKVKKDYLLDGAMADSADLVVLGAWYGTGKKGGMMSVFLMGCFDEDRNRWLTVTKVHTGHDDVTLERLQGELKMGKIGKDVNLLPSWLHANKAMVPDFVAKDPKKQPVWEITGAEFTNQGVHTADGISIRFPRVTRIRDDKDWKTATSLKELRTLFARSSDSVDVSLLLGNQTTSTSTVQRSLDSMLKPKAEKSEIENDGNSGNNQEELDEKSETEKCDEKNPSLLSRNGIARGNGSEVKLEGDVKTTTEIKEEPKSHGEDAHPSTRRGAKRKSDVLIDVKMKKEPDFSTTSTSSEGDGSSKRKRLPRDLDESDYTDHTTNKAFKTVRVLLARDVKKDRRKALRNILKTLGAKVLEEEDQHLATHVIHSKAEVPTTIIQNYRRIYRKPELVQSECKGIVHLAWRKSGKFFFYYPEIENATLTPFCCQYHWRIYGLISCTRNVSHSK
ncbi:DNA ligase 3 isoform X1 [Neodiprion fabricii]|uniref:DNA ligase 3 isoform X1 n=1 Tax=Neodiprion fabricii TaxID=2872261 RepID=UPI001ED96F4D|nr:DNA ligase 3 isoform X1 [Neodiprion fabricii]